FKKLVHHHLGHTVQHPLPNTGDQASDFGIRAILEQGLTVVVFQVDGYVALHKARPSRSFAAQNIMGRWLLVFDGNLSFIISLHRCDANLHRGLVLVWRDFLETFTAGHALRHYFWIHENFPNSLFRRVERMTPFNLQAALPPPFWRAFSAGCYRSARFNQRLSHKK